MWDIKYFFKKILKGRIVKDKDYVFSSDDDGLITYE